MIEQRVEQEIGRADLETILLRQTEIKQQIDFFEFGYVKFVFNLINLSSCCPNCPSIDQP